MMSNTLSSKLLKTLELAALLAPFACVAGEAGEASEPDPGWIGDCYYYADGGYYHKDGVYWRADMKTHYVYEEECWHLANGASNAASASVFSSFEGSVFDIFFALSRYC